MKQWSWVGVACALVALAGCGDDDGTVPEDSGAAEDAGSSTPDGGGGIDGGSGVDAGAPVDAGPVDAYLPPPSCEASRIRIEETCAPAFAACGGPVLGAWCYAEICIEKDELLAQALMQPGVPADCDTSDITVVSSTGTVEGTLDFSATSVHRVVSTEASGVFHLTPDCMIVNCRATEGALDAALEGTGSATCTNGTPDGCDCEITFTSSIDDTDDYTVLGDAIVFANGRRFDYCVEEDGALRFHETGDAIEPGIQTALPR